MQNLHNLPAAWQANEGEDIGGGCGTVDMSGQGIREIAAEMAARGGDAKLALVMPHPDPLRLPAWGITFPIQNQRRLASASMGRPKAAIVAPALRSPAKRGA
ncbi:hypothetical protein [Bradyrhizobium paxllaeri]|uniref:hypothetical protein n=1 Tax=Bradyrhizobium paxllaeri TaxID=190148 RepID=UPI0008109EEB|nr:hypothetical protein [Bradyrhizobium paxllaeri]